MKFWIAVKNQQMTFDLYDGKCVIRETIYLSYIRNVIYSKYSSTADCSIGNLLIDKIEINIRRDYILL